MHKIGLIRQWQSLFKEIRMVEIKLPFDDIPTVLATNATDKVIEYVWDTLIKEKDDPSALELEMNLNLLGYFAEIPIWDELTL